MTKETPVAVKSKEDRKEQWLDEEVYFEFYNLKDPGIAVKFSFGPTNNSKKYMLLHGGKYRYPRRLVQHLESKQTPDWNYVPDGSGSMHKSVTGYTSRFQCRQIFE